MREIKNQRIKRRKSLKEKGITLIALVVTIVILLILTGVTLNLALSENGLFERVKDAGEESRGASVQEAKVLWETDKEMAKLSNDDNAKTKDEFLSDLVKQGLLKEEEKKEIEDTGKVKIGSRIIEFEEEKNGKTLVQAFKDGEIHVGDYVVNYNDTINDKSATAELETYETGYNEKQTYNVDENTTWRVLGLSKDEKNLIITTGSPIKKNGDDPYLYLGGAEGWYNAGVLKKEEGNILDRVCNIYAGEYAKETRSIRFEDITNALGIEIDKTNNKAYKVKDGEKIELKDFVKFGESEWTYQLGDYAPENYLLEKYPERYTNLTRVKAGDVRNTKNNGRGLWMCQYDTDIGSEVENKVADFLIGASDDKGELSDPGDGKSYWLASYGVGSALGQGVLAPFFANCGFFRRLPWNTVL